MNENTNEMVGDAEKVATLKAANNGLLYPADAPFDVSDGEAAHEEASEEAAD